MIKAVYKTLLTAFFIYLCSCNEVVNSNEVNKAIENKVEQQSSENETSSEIIKQQEDITNQTEIIEQIVVLSNNIDKNLKNYQRRDTTVIGYSAEGTELIGYFENNSIKKIIAEHAGETGKAKEEYYFDNSQLVLTVQKRYTYDKPIYESNQQKVVSQEEERFYFNREILLKWIKGKSELIKEGDNYAKQTQQLIKYYKEYLNKLSRQ